jgi:hypothetical protein
VTFTSAACVGPAISATIDPIAAVITADFSPMRPPPVSSSGEERP